MALGRAKPGKTWKILQWHVASCQKRQLLAIFGDFCLQNCTILAIFAIFLAFLCVFVHFWVFWWFWGSVPVLLADLYDKKILLRTHEMKESHQYEHYQWWPLACNGGKKGQVLYSQFWSSTSTQSSGQTLLIILIKNTNISPKVQKVRFGQKWLKKPTKT